MENAQYVGLSRHMALQRQMATVANNIANMNTAGYRSQQMLFQSHMHEPDASGAPAHTSMSMVIDHALLADTRAGAIIDTQNALDVALVGDGFLRVQSEAGPRYTRSGHLSLDLDGQLVNSLGRPVMTPTNGAIVIPPGTDRISIAEDGTVSADDVLVGQIDIVEFDDPRQLEPLGGTLFATNSVPRPAENTSLVQGAIENSNVQPIVEMSQMIEIARAYESTQRMMQNEHERHQSAIRRLGQMASA